MMPENDKAVSAGYASAPPPDVKPHKDNAYDGGQLGVPTAEVKPEPAKPKAPAAPAPTGE